MRNNHHLSLRTSFQQPPPDHTPHNPTNSDSPTTSPSLSPSSPFRRLFNRNSSAPRSDTTTTSDIDPSSSSRSHSPFCLSAVFRRPSLVLLRRRPSKVDMALSAERSRCDGDAIERQGLDLMEPRPVDPIGLVPVPMDLMAQSFFSPDVGDRASTQSWQTASSASRLSQPRFVMGGIFEVMEGRA